MESGFVLGYSRLLGYRVKNGVLSIVPDEAEVVRRIFNEYVYERKGAYRIAQDLNNDGIRSVRGMSAATSVICLSMSLLCSITPSNRKTASLWQQLTARIISDRPDFFHRLLHLASFFNFAIKNQHVTKMITC